jgi:release factor glutamine methyltransferase
VLAPETTRAEAISALRAAFVTAGWSEAAQEARLLVRRVLNLDPMELVLRPDEPLGEAAERLQAMAYRRLAREPLARLLGEREFWGLLFRLSPDTLEPRPDTETVVGAALDALPDPDAPVRLLDLGTGSGCLLVALLAERPRAVGLGADRSEGALRTARANAARNGVGDRASFVLADWGAALRGPFDLIVSNPPYIPSSDLAGLDPEVRLHDPRAALDGGLDGLAAYRAILAQAPRLLAPAGHLILEVGAAQADPVARLGRKAGFELLGVRPDLGRIPRAVTLRLKGRDAENAGNPL